MNDYQMTIGIECHVQLATATKLFSPADNDARDAAPNSKTHPIDFGLPGMLPVLNREAITLAVRAAKALNAEVARESRFDRKHYFYPDLPNGYQITQMYQPTILAGYVDAPLDDGQSVRVRINHAHLEMDAGKLTHYGDYSLVDLNRAGTPLIEIVSEADMHSPEEARAYATELHRLMTYAGITHGDLYHGNMRFDVNLSVAKKGSDTLGIRTETKNLNSFRSVERAAAYEFKRQVELLERGERIVQETRGWNDDKGVTTSQRSKEDAQDYRYMPDADIPPVVLTDDEIAHLQAAVPKLPPEYRAEFAELGVDKSVVATILASRDYAELVSSVLAAGGVSAAKRVANWIASASAVADSSVAIPRGTAPATDNPIGLVTPDGVDVGSPMESSVAVAAREGLVADDSDGLTQSTPSGVTGPSELLDANSIAIADVADLLALVDMVEKSEVTSNAATELFGELMNGAHDPRVIAEERGLLQNSDEDAIAAIVDAVLADPASAQAVADIQAGNDKAIGYLVGQVMKQSKGQANPSLAQKLIRERL